MAKKQTLSTQGDLFGNPFSSPETLQEKADFSKNSTLIKDKDGSTKTIGASVTERALNNAVTPQEVDESIVVGNEVQNDAKLNSNILTAIPDIKTVDNSNAVAPENPNVANGNALMGVLGFNKYQERGVPQLSNQDIQQALIEQNPEVKQQLLDEFNSYANNQNAVTPALERLGIQDYYPDLNANIAVGSYSRKTLGSGNIYVAQGGFIPRTVIDARNRAMENQAKQAQAKVDDIKTKRFVTSEQYQQQYDDAYLDWLNQNIKDAGSNVQHLTDPNTQMGRNFLEQSARWENLYKENKYVDGIADDITG